MKEKILNHWKIKEIENLEELDEFLSKKIKDYKVKNINDFFKYIDKLKDLDKEVELNVYEGADHNMLGSWNQAVKKSLNWFETKKND